MGTFPGSFGTTSAAVKTPACHVVRPDAAAHVSGARNRRETGESLSAEAKQLIANVGDNA